MKNQHFLLKLLLLFLATIWIAPSKAQISFGGTPPSFSFENRNEQLMSEIILPIDFDLEALRAEDEIRQQENLPPRVGTIIPVCFTTENSGEWTTLPDGQDIWRLSIIAPDAIAIMLYYDKFEIPRGGKLFIYNNDRSQLLGAFTEENNPTRVEFATDFVAGDHITLEYVPPFLANLENNESPIYITGVCYGYNHNHMFTTKYENGRSGVEFRAGNCMVGINCPEGANWQNEKRGVIRTTQRIGLFGSYMCTGTLINNTSGNLDQLFLSANHCYQEGSTEANYAQTVFYFNHEHSGCSGSDSSPSGNSVTGATMLTKIPLNAGSDGILLRVTPAIPSTYNVYFNGWDRRNIAATSGVSIHHPAGHQKKISTFTAPAVSTGNNPFEGGDVTAPNSMWRVIFAQTANGHSVTEGGSSGSPVFNQDKRVVGTLSGGNSSCSEPTGINLYGKLWYHWDQYNTTAQMKPYLDPIDNGREFIDGINQVAIAFSCSTNDINLAYTNASEQMSITANHIWYVTDISDSWFSVSVLTGSGNETLIITADDNSGFTTRTGTFFVGTHFFAPQQITVTQAPSPIIFDINPKIVELADHQGASDILTIDANMTWTVDQFPSWISLSTLSGSGNDQIELIANDNTTSNPRTGTLTIINSEWSQSESVTITQQAKIVTLDASTDEINLGFTANSNDDFDIIASHNWNIASSVGWLTITPNNGTGNETVNVKATENSSLTPRNATLTITSYYQIVTIDVIQEAFVSIFSLDLDEITLNKENNSNLTVELSSNRMWTAQKVGTWFNFAPTMGVGNATITITATSENTAAEPRNGTITFTNNLLESIVLNVSQLGTEELYWQVSVFANPTEGGNVTGDGLFLDDTEITVTATPSQHYNFVNWTEDGAEVSTSQNYTFIVTDDIDLVANFTLKSYEVSVSALPSEGGNVSGDGMYVYNTEATVTATPSQHYNFVNWTENGTEVSTSQNYTFTVIDDIELVANFIPNSYEVTVSAMPSEGGNVSGGGMYIYNTETTVTATPNDCYNFINWTNENNPVSTNPNYTFYVTEDVELEANFALKTFTVTITANSEEGNVSGGGTFECGTIINLVATPSVGYCFVKWLINGEVVETGTTYSFEIEEDVIITVEFELCSFIVTVEAGEGGIVQGGGTYNFGENAEVTATPNDDYKFINWTNEDGDEVSDENPFIFLVISDITLIANFEPVPIVFYTVTLLVNNDEWGTVAGEGEYEADTEAEVTATPEDYYKFVNWTNEDGDEVSDNNIFIFFVTGDITLTANFEYDEGILKTEISGFTIYPNPAKDILTVIGSTKVKATIEIFNGIGSLLIKEEMKDIETKIDVSSLSSGVYILRLTHERGSSVLKFVKE